MTIEIELSNLIPGIFLLLVSGLEIFLFIHFLRYEKTLAIKSYLGFIAGIIIWVFSNGLSLLLGNGDVSFIQSFAFIAGILISTCFLLFVHTFPESRSKLVYKLKYLPIVSVIIFSLLLVFFEEFYVKVELTSGVMRTDPVSTGLWAWSIFFLIVWTFAVIELVRRFLNSVGSVRKRFLFLLIGVFISSLVGILTDVIFPLFGVIHFSWLGPSVSVVWVWFCVKAIKL